MSTRIVVGGRVIRNLGRYCSHFLHLVDHHLRTRFVVVVVGPAQLERWSNFSAGRKTCIPQRKRGMKGTSHPTSVGYCTLVGY